MSASIIEQAVNRLAELRRSGIEVPVPARDNPVAVAAGPGPVSSIRPLGEATTRRSESAKASKSVTIDLARMTQMGYLTPEAPRSRIADEFRVIKRPLLRNILRQDEQVLSERPQLIMVTSALPGEGKTFVSINLAMSLAMELDTTVLLVDADVARPSVLSRLGLPPGPGLLDLLTNPALAMSDVMLRTNVEKLTLLPSGNSDGRATELLASDSMDRLLDELARRYSDRVIVFDAPPLLPSTESRVLAAGMGQVVVVVEAEKTPQKVVAQAMATIESCPLVMPLLNKIRTSDVGAYYGYYDPVDR